MPVIKYSMPGLSKVRAAVKLTEGQIASRDAVAINASLELVKHAIEPQIPVGPGHFGYHARDRIFTRISAGKRVAGILYTTAPQLRWRERGTRPHNIGYRVSGVHTGFMGQSVGSASVMVKHPGEKPRPVFKRTLAAMKSTIRAIFVGSTQRMLAELARDGSTPA